MKLVSSLENISPAFVLYFGDATFCKHVITYITEDLELLNASEVMWCSRFCNNLGDVCLEHDYSIVMMITITERAVIK